MKKKLLLIDGHSILFRAFYGLPLLTTGAGEYTNAVFGFLNILFKFLDEESPDYLAVAFDLSTPTFRHKAYEPYKGTRGTMPNELTPQIGLIQNLLRLMNIHVVTLEGFEADDILGTIATKSDANGLDVVIVTGDRDLLQVATDSIRIRIAKTKYGKTEVEDYLAADVAQKIGVTPTEYIDVKALMGDTSDNIPGVPGIGEKTALKIIQEYHTVENSIANADKIKPARASQNLKQYSEIALLSKRLATIDLNTPIECKAEQYKINSVYNHEAFAEIRRLEFKRLFPRFADKNTRTEIKTNRRIIKNRDSLESTLAQITSPVAFQLLWNNDVFYGISFTWGGESAFVKVEAEFAESEIFAGCAAFFSSELEKITLNVKKTLVYLMPFDIKLNQVVFDSMLAAYVLNSSKGAYECEDISSDYLQQIIRSRDDFWGKGKLKRNDISDKELMDFACTQTEVILSAYSIMKEKLIENNEWDLFRDIELRLTYVIANMERAGIALNRRELTDYGVELSGLIDILVQQIYDLAGENFNINSPGQIGEILFVKLNLKGGKKTKTGYSTAVDVLEKLRDDHPIVNKILDYRTLSKLKSTYIDGLLGVLREDGKIYSTFNQTVASTGRLSSSEPNLQNIPVRIELGRRLRKAFVPSDESFIFLDGDYSQIELRVLAHMSGDEALIDAFKQNLDIHRLTASQVFHTPFNEVTPFQRSAAKAVNFGIIYGIGAFSLSQDLSISRKEAEEYIQGYFDRYPKVRVYMTKLVTDAVETGFASTLFGRRRSIPELTSSNFNIRSFGERVAMNMPIQGTAADIIKIAMINTDCRLKQEGMKSRLILQVHDELLLEAKRDELEELKLLLKESMENAVSMAVPLQADLHIGETWYDAK
ncbi:MAG: DNA polymerase I [Clostridiales bacterium]|jgi:DNA polymerase-1|nr:DNA polymerase I [Clostridiales bacterium]